MNKKLYKIAEKYSYAVEKRGSLEIKHNDSDDFLDISVWHFKKC